MTWPSGWDLMAKALLRAEIFERHGEGQVAWIPANRFGNCIRSHTWPLDIRSCQAHC